MGKEVAKVGGSLSDIESLDQLTEQRRKQIHKESTALYADTIAMGVRRTLQQAAALHNIKTFQTYIAEGYKTWKEFCEANGIDRPYTYQYLGIARALITSAVEGAEPETFLFTKQHLDAIYKGSSDYFRSMTMRQLYDASSRFDAHSTALNATEIHRLLPPPKDGDGAEPEERKQKSEFQDFNDHMAKLCEANDWVWNKKEQRCEHTDGTPLTDRELGAVTMPETAFGIFKNVQNKVTSVLTKVEDEIARDCQTYMRYAKHIPNPAFEKRVDTLRKEVAKRFEQTMLMLDALIECDEKRIKTYRKHGIGE